MKKLLALFCFLTILVGYICGSYNDPWTSSKEIEFADVPPISFTTNANVGIGNLITNDPNGGFNKAFLFVADLSVGISYNFKHCIIGVSPSYNMSINLISSVKNVSASTVNTFSLQGEIGYCSKEKGVLAAYMLLVGYNFGLQGIEVGCTIRNIRERQGKDFIKILSTLSTVFKVIKVDLTVNVLSLF